MNSTWFNAYLAENTPGIEWGDKQREIACSLLFDIAEANGGAVFADSELPAEALRQHAVERADEAVRRRMNGYAQSVRKQIPQFFFSETLAEMDGALTALHRWRAKLNLNTASMEELEALPAIGDVLAQRIVAHRNRYGAFESVEQLKAVKGIDEGITAEIADRVFVMPGQFHAQYLSNELMALAADPSLANYTVLLLAGGRFGMGMNPCAEPSACLLSELASIRDDVRQNKFASHRHLPMPRSSRIGELAALRQRAQELGAGAIREDNARAGLLFDSAYFTFTRELLRKARKSIKIIMFYMHFDDRGEDTPGDQMVKEVLAAKRRGVAVQVILDRDRSGDVFKSRIINDNAFKALRAAQAEVFFEERNRATHTKLVIVDDSHVILGSHNWTTGSLQDYDDTSIYVASKQLAEDYAKDFNARFDVLKNAA
jgi:competence ComEA-like helix-hairpin-helix protein